MAVIRSKQSLRSERAYGILNQLKALYPYHMKPIWQYAMANHLIQASEIKGRRQEQRLTTKNLEIRTLINKARRLTEELVKVCNVPFEGKEVIVSLKKAFAFDHNVMPCELVIPLQAMLSATMPVAADPSLIKAHAPFAQDMPHIHCKCYCIHWEERDVDGFCRHLR